MSRLPNDPLTEAFLKDLETIVSLDSNSQDPEGVDSVGRYFKAEFEKLHWHIREIDCGKKTGKLLEIYNLSPEHYDVTFVGHMDTVFPKGTAGERPFTVHEGRAYGPGVADMKQGDLAMLYIAKSLKRETLEKTSICMLFTPDEEIGSLYSRPYLIDVAQRSDRVFIMEACLLDGSYCTSRSGRVNYRVKFHGIAAHAGFAFSTENASAVDELGRWICALAELRCREKNTTVNVAPVSGGIASNVIADEAELSCEIRFQANDEMERVQLAVRQMVENPFTSGVSVEILEDSRTPAWSTSAETAAYVCEVKETAASLGQEFRCASRGGLSDANTMAQYCRIVIDGMGPRGQFGHSLKECLDIQGIKPCIDLCTELIKKL